MTKNINFWNRLAGFSKNIKIDSFTVGGLSLTFKEEENNENLFSLIRDRINEKSREKGCDVFVISAHNIDEVNLIDHINADHECEVIGEVSIVPGGSGANSAYTLACLGASVSISGAIGGDKEGELLRLSLIESGVNVDALIIDRGAISGKTTTIVEKSGKRLIVVSPGVNNNFKLLANKEDLIRKSKSAKIVHFSSFVGSDEILLQVEIAKEVSDETVISLTPGALYSRQGLDRLVGLIEHTDIIFLYKEQLIDLINKSSANLLLKGNKGIDYLSALYKWRSKNKIKKPLIVVVKEAFDDSFEHTTKRFLAVSVGSSDVDRYMEPKPLSPGVKLDMPDTTGAGDAAVAGFLIGMLQSASLESCLDSAFLMSSFASTKIGARTAFSKSSEMILSKKSDMALLNG